VPARPRKKPEQAEETADKVLPNALRRATRRGFQRDTSPKADLAANPTPEQVRAAAEELRGVFEPSDLATGRGLTYEWEIFLAELGDRVRVLELGGGGGGGGLRYVHTQAVPSASWVINHALLTKPSVTIVGSDGQQLIAEVHYPDDNNTVINFGAPYVGTAYLSG